MRLYLLLFLATVGGMVAQSGCKKAGRATLSEETYQQFALQLQDSVNARNLEFFNQQFDLDGIITKVTTSVAAPAHYATDFSTYIRQGMDVGGQIVGSLGQVGKYKLLRIKDYPNNPTALFRLANEQGINYHELYLGEREGKVYVKDFYIYRGGLSFSHTLHRIYYSTLSENKNSIKINQLPKVEREFIENIGLIDSIGTLVNQNQHQQALELAETLPATLQKDKMVRVMQINVAYRSDSTKYEKLLNQLRNDYDDATAEFLDMQFAYMGRDSLHLLEKIDALDKKLGGDPYLNVIRADVYSTFKQNDKVLESLNTAIKQEPDMEDAYWRLVNVMNQEGRYDEAVAYFSTIKEKFDTNVADFLPPDDPDFEKLRATDSYKQWVLKNPLDTTKPVTPPMSPELEELLRQQGAMEEGEAGHEGHNHP